MTSKSHSQRNNGGEVVNDPASRRKASQIDHHAGEQDDHDVHVLEVVDDARNLSEKVGVGLFFAGSAPLHVDVEEMA